MNRRNFFTALTLAPLAGLELAPKAAASINCDGEIGLTLAPSTGLKLAPSPIREAPSPKFWFGDRVSYLWPDEQDSSIQQSEDGEVVGVCWHPLDKQWQYSVIWLSSSLYTKDFYPYFDNRPVLEDELARLYSEGELARLHSEVKA
ncbi:MULTISPECIES: hypothetical protein [Kamptonema]|uniref:hypothetical protein n=1 Tax=Kamptonema TaxID=1501433 RepID=UPI0001DAD274|nr:MULTISPECIES: hypothetical protein [Kamptonema]CBN58285.1 exported hypothetical protein [Kamptonema sp. PCC 6506]